MKTSVAVATTYGEIAVPILQCDSCGKRTREIQTTGWLRLKPLGNEIISLVGKPPWGDFCSLSCLHARIDQLINPVSD